MAKTMANVQNEVMLTVVLMAGTLILIWLTKNAIKRFGKLASIDVNSRKVVFYLSYLAIYLVSITILLIIWGLNLEDFAVFIASVLAVLGVGFFAQWSILSNITASVILFFFHPLRLGHRVRILDNDFDWTGEVKDISAFYLFMQTDDGRKVTIPTNLVIQKGIEILEKEV